MYCVTCNVLCYRYFKIINMKTALLIPKLEKGYATTNNISKLDENSCNLWEDIQESKIMITGESRR